MDTVFLVLYVVFLGSVAAIILSTFNHARRAKTSLGPGRFISLAGDEARRLTTGDPVFLMHLSIALGVGLSILTVVLEPVYQTLPLLNSLFLLVSVPLIAGLVVAFGWRVERFSRSKKVESDLGVGGDFRASSSKLQGVLMLAIALTATELLVGWLPVSPSFAALVGTARNMLVVVYYTRPTVNLTSGFDVPLRSVSTPFLLSDVLSGKTDPSQIRVGVSSTSEFTRAEKLSYDSCVEIGACEAACPATAAGRPLSPRVLVRKLSLLSSAEEKSQDPFSTVGEDELWSCTSCGACVSSCPVSVKHLDIVYDLRRQLVAAGKLDREKTAMLESLATNQNPYGLKSDTRGDWATGLDVPTLSSNPGAEYVYWVGCVSSFDQRAQKIARSMVKILRAAGVSFAILGSDEFCTGDPARRLGEEGRYQELALQNIEKLQSLGAKKIIAACPHCFNALANEYPQFGGNFEVVYHTQMVSDLIASGRLKVPEERVQNISVTLHDACYAARYNNVFDEPRAALKTAVADLREMGRRKEKTFCCGAGGSNYWFKVPQQRSIAGIRTEEAKETGAKEVATECPFCLSMFEDTAKVMETGMEVKDVAEIVAECL